MKPSPTVNGSRSAAISGGRTAFRTATRSATRNAAPVWSSATPGSSQAATAIEAALTTQPITRRSGRRRGFSGCHSTASP